MLALMFAFSFVDFFSILGLNFGRLFNLVFICG